MGPRPAVRAGHLRERALTIAFYRLWLAVPITFLIALASGSRLTLRVLRVSALPGLLFSVSIMAGFVSYQKTSVANASLIPALQPLLVLLVAGRLFGERVGRRELWLGALSLVGITMVVLGAGHTGGASLVGDLFAVVNLVTFTAYFLVIKHRRSVGVPAAALLSGMILCAAIFVTPIALLGSGDLHAIGGTDWLWLVLLVLLPGTLGHGLMNWAQRYVDVTVSSLMSLGNPVVSAIGAWLVFDEALNATQILGAALVLAALAGIVAHQRVGSAIAEAT